MSKDLSMERAISDLNSCVVAMVYAHGANGMAEAITRCHGKTIARAQRRVLRAPCPVCEDSACEVNSDECGKG